MNDVEFFAKAQSDSVFREQKLEEARFQKNATLGFSLVFVASWSAYAIYCGVAQYRWAPVDSLWFSLLLCLFVYGQARTRVSVLRAMNQAAPAQNREISVTAGRGLISS